MANGAAVRLSLRPELRPRGSRRSPPRPFGDGYSAQPCAVVPIDLNYIRDHQALTPEQILHRDRCGIPHYHWGALEVSSRFKLIASSQGRTGTNGRCCSLWTIAWLRSHGVTATITGTVDHGEECGGPSWLKVQERRKLIAGFGCRLIQNHQGHPEEHAPRSAEPSSRAQAEGLTTKPGALPPH